LNCCFHCFVFINDEIDTTREEEILIVVQLPNLCKPYANKTGTRLSEEITYLQPGTQVMQGNNYSNRIPFNFSVDQVSFLRGD